MSDRAVSFTVLGVAQPKGSAKAFAFRRKNGSLGAAVTSDNRSLKGWETMVRSAAQQQCGGAFFDGAVRLAVVFFLPRPKSKPASVKHHLTRPDLSKLLRGIEDALTGVLWMDDSSVVEIVARKAYAAARPEARIIVDDAEPVTQLTLTNDLFAPLEATRAAQ
jgi:Holliday junction resolvase RusA-like endonuclease